MLNAVSKSGFTPIIFCLLFASAVYAQDLGDLGSSNEIFRPSGNPKTSVGAKKTRKPAVKTSGRISTAKPKAKSSSISTVAPNRRVVNELPDEDIIIAVGRNSPSRDDLFESAIEKGNEARDARDYLSAEKSYLKAQNINPKDWRAKYGLGNVYSDQQRWEEAEKAYRQAIQLEPQSPEAHIALSFVLTQPVVGVNLSSRYAEAEKAARRAIQLDPENAVAFDQLGVALELRGAIGSETREAYRKAVELDPKFALAHAHLSRLYRRNGRNTEAEKSYREAVRLATDVPTMILVADVLQSQQRFLESEQLLRRALQDDPRNPSALFLLGRALMVRNAFEEAEKLLKRSVEVSPNSFVSYTQLASLYTRCGNYAEAERTLMRALSVVSPNEKKRLALEFELVGDGLMRLGRRLDAARVYRQAATLNPEKGELAEKLADARKR
jgi:Tfp pilus assembly protein PilF